MIYLAINTSIHILMIIGVFVSLILQLIFVKKEIDSKTLKLISKTDATYGVAAILVVTTGLLNWLKLGKGYEYYANNTLFIIKFSLFIVIGLLSIYPTVVFAKLKKKQKNDPSDIIAIPHYPFVIATIKAEIGILLIMPFLATLMANGIDITDV